jgi:hypothetical protein
MKQLMIVLALTVVMVTVNPAASVALEKACYPNMVCLGTSSYDVLYGTPRADVIRGLGGADAIEGGGGDDRISGGAGNERIASGKGKDWIACGAGGRDAVVDASPIDNISDDCENVQGPGAR